MTEYSLISEIVGYGACVAMVLGYLPQAIRTIRTRSTDDIALATFLLMSIDLHRLHQEDVANRHGTILRCSAT